MADYLAQFDAGSIDAIHLLSHGAQGQINLGDLTLTSGNLNESSTLLSQIGASLATSGDFLVYGCDVAKGADGVAFVDALALATQADIAASNDLTGAAALEGDWTLEYATDSVVASNVDSSWLKYDGTLATPITMNLSYGTIFVRPGGTSFTWTYGQGLRPSNMSLYATISTVDYHNADFPPTGVGPEDWILTRGKFQYSTNGGTTWTDYAYPANGSTNFVPVAGTVWHFVDTLPGDTTTTNSIGNAWTVVGEGGNVGGGATIAPDNAPTDLTLDKNYFLSGTAQGTSVAKLTPVDTGLTKGGYWAIDSQSVANLFVISSAPATDNTATLTLGTGAMPAIGQTATVTARYYDPYQTDASGNPLNGDGFSKLLTFTVIDPQSKDLSGFGNDIKVSTTTANAQINPDVATLSNGNFVTIWQSEGQGGEGGGKHGIYGQIHTAGGVAVGSEFVISEVIGTDEITPVVTALAGG